MRLCCSQGGGGLDPGQYQRGRVRLCCSQGGGGSDPGQYQRGRVRLCCSQGGGLRPWSVPEGESEAVL